MVKGDAVASFDDVSPDDVGNITEKSRRLRPVSEDRFFYHRKALSMRLVIPCGDGPWSGDRGRLVYLDINTARNAYI